MRSVNKVILVGNVTRDGEVSYTTNGTAVCYFTVATNRAWKDANGDWKDEASFHSVMAWGKFGEGLAKVLQKGMKVYVEGLLTYRERRDDAGKLISKDARIRADSVVVLDKTARAGSGDDFEASHEESAPKSGGDFDLDAIAQGLDEAKGSSGTKATTPVTDDDLPF
ncbi:MAG: single-stranded DNA-binding protein [Candidatus Dojkabacteria bacterium]|nr:MAG: single-stranded DNA-binding protein [Candidatus Dojkabacteria bacterium]